MNDAASTPGSPTGDVNDNEAGSVGSARLNEPPTEAERVGIVDQQGALIAEMREDDQG